MCVDVHDVIFSKQQSSQSIIKHTLCRAFPQRSFPLILSLALTQRCMKARIHQKSCNILQHLHSTKTEEERCKKGNARKKKKTFYLFMLFFTFYFYLLQRNFEIHYCLLQAMMTIALPHSCSLLYLRFSPMHILKFIDLKINCDIESKKSFNMH